MTPLVRITLGAATDWYPELQAGDAVEVDAVRGAMILAEVPGSAPETEKDAELLAPYLPPSEESESAAEDGDPPKARMKKGKR